MDFRYNTVLKEHYAFFVGDRDAQVVAGEHGFYVRDTRMLSRYAWRWLPGGGPEPQTLVVAAPGDYPFYCSIHGTATRGQTGYLVVGDG